MKKGKFVVVDGLDGVGKGVFLDTFVEEAKKDNKFVFDVHEFWKIFEHHPSLTGFPVSHINRKIDLIVTSEPTYIKVGKIIREKLIANNGIEYNPKFIAEAYAKDRMMLYKELILPALEQGIDVFQSRSLSSTIVYQRQSAIDDGLDFNVKDILSLSGNKFCYNHPMDYLVIPTIENVEEVMDRLENREKEDNCIFENLEFQLKLKEQYESEDFREIFESKGVKVVYLDAGKSLEHSKKLAREFYQQYLK